MILKTRIGESIQRAHARAQHDRHRQHKPQDPQVRTSLGMRFGSRVLSLFKFMRINRLPPIEFRMDQLGHFQDRH